MESLLQTQILERYLERSSRTFLGSSSSSTNFRLSFDFKSYVFLVASSPLPLLTSSKWGYLMPDSLSKGQIIDIFRTRKKDHERKAFSSVFCTTADYPVIFHVCNESKAEALKKFPEYKCCALDIGTAEPVYFNPAIDAIFLQKVDPQAISFPGLDKVQHLIVHDRIDPRGLAQHCPCLKDLTIVVHGNSGRCRSKDMTKKLGLKLYKPQRTTIYCESMYRSQDDALDRFKRSHPNWKKPILNALSATINGERCCKLDNYATIPFPGLRPVELQNSSFWEEHCVPDPYY